MVDTTFVVVCVLSIILMGTSVFWILLKAARNVRTYSFVACQTLIVIWLVGALVEIFSVNTFQLWIGYVLTNISICLIAPFWLNFSVYYAEKKMPKILNIILFLISGAFYTAIITNPKHYLYYSHFEWADWNVVHGVLFYLNQVYIYTLMIIGVTMMFRYAGASKHKSAEQVILLALSVGTPLAVNVISQFGLIRTSCDPTPIAFVVSSIFVLLATYQYGFLDVNAVAFEEAFSVVEEGIIVFDKREKISYMSKAAGELLGLDKSTDHNGFVEFLSQHSAQPVGEYFEYAEISIDGKILGLKRYKVTDERYRVLASIVIVTDITRYYELVESNKELDAAEQNLAIEQERNRIAQEVHDTVGHTFTMISSLSRLGHAELVKTNAESDKQKLDEYFSEIQSLSRGGITQLRCSINNLRDGVFLSSVSAAIKTVADAVRDMETEIYVQGVEDERYGFMAKPVYEMCRELVTNTARYSGAKRMDFILKLLEEGMELYVFDNGKGCQNINIHNGLSGIIQKTQALGGTARFHSSEGNGFSTIIKIPLNEKLGE